MNIHYFLRNFNVMNLLLISVTALFLQYGFFPFSSLNPFNPPPAPGTPSEAGQETAEEMQIPSPADYTGIAEENLFHPERKIPVEKKAEQPLPKPDFVLYGTMLSDTMSLAYMEDLKVPRNSPGRGKRQTALRKGEALSGFTLKEIETDKVVMVRGEEKIIIPVNDAAHPKERTTSVAVAAPPGKTQQTPAQESRVQKATARSSAFPQTSVVPPPSSTTQPGKIFEPRGNRGKGGRHIDTGSSPANTQ